MKVLDFKSLLVLSLVLVLSVSCTKGIDQDGNALSDDMGTLSLSLSAEAVKSEITRSGEDNGQVATDDPNEPYYDGSQLPPVDSFMVEIYKKLENGESRIYRDTFCNTKTEIIKLNSGDYRVYAGWGNPKSVGFKSASYEVSKELVVRPQTHEKFDILARLGKVKVKVIHGANFDAPDISNVYTLIKNTSDDCEIKFEKGETRDGYITPGKLQMDVRFTYEGKEWQKVIDLKRDGDEDVDFLAADYLVLNIEQTEGRGTLNISYSVDNTMNSETITTTLDAEWGPRNAPILTSSGFVNGQAKFNEKGILDAKFSVKAEYFVKNFILNFALDFKDKLGLPDQLDLMNLTDEQIALLKGLGANWIDKHENQMWANFNLAGMAKTINALEGAPFRGLISVKIIDSIDTEVSTQTYEIKQQRKMASLNITDDMIYSRSIRRAEVKALHGADLTKIYLQYSVDGENWKDVEGAENITGLEPATKYYVRPAYTMDLDYAGEAIEITTESGMQLGNSGFEEWTTERFDHDNSEAYVNVPWYSPYSGADRWWSANSLRTMVAVPHEGTMTFTPFKCRPTVYMASASGSVHSGNGAAMLATIAVGDATISADVLGGQIFSSAGEIFVGTNKSDGSHQSEGHAFDARPDKFAFWYKYIPYNDEQFVCKIVFKDVDNNVVASAELTNGGAASDWVKLELPLNYVNNTSKITSVYAYFKTTDSVAPAYQKTKHTFDTGENTDVFMGSVLYLDDLELIYE